MGAAGGGAGDGAEDMELVGRADPQLGTSVAQALTAEPDVLVDFTVPKTALANAREAAHAGVHVVIGTTGFDLAALDDLSGCPGHIFVAPNFAIGAVLMMRFAAEAAPHIARAELLEPHPRRKGAAPT